MNLRFNKKIIITVIAFSIFILFYNLGLLKPLEKIFSIFFDPSSVKIVKLGADTNKLLAKTTTSKNDLIQEIARLKNQLTQANLNAIESLALERENQELRSILNFKNKHDYRLLLGELINKTNLELDRSVVINKGSKDGVKKGNAVIVKQGILIGKVDRVDTYKSSIKLTIDNGTQILATLDNFEHTITGVLTGTKGNSLSLNLIPKNLTIISGQKIVTNGLQEFIPANLYVGEIINLQESPNEIFNSALVAVPYTIEDLTTATIILDF